jgi:hypothetical protein
MSKRNKILLSALTVGALGSVAALGIFGFFTATTQNAGNEISTGTVAFTDNDAGSALYNVTGAKPGDSVSKCIKTSYTGTLPAAVHLYSPSTPGTLGQYVDMTITQGTQVSSTFPDCTGFTPDADGTIFTGTLQAFEQTYSNYATGIATDPPGATIWAPSDTLVYRFNATLRSTTPDTAQAASTGVHSFVWEAHSN